MTNLSDTLARKHTPLKDIIADRRWQMLVKRNRAKVIRVIEFTDALPSWGSWQVWRNKTYRIRYWRFRP